MIDESQMTLKISASHTNLFKSLCNLQAELTPAEFNRKNPFHKNQYADLNSIYAMSRPIMAEHGLFALQPLHTFENGKIVLVTLLGHTSGEWMESTVSIEVKPDSKNPTQELGSIITYLRRYAISSMLGISSDKEEDDGNSSQRDEEPKKTQYVTLEHSNPPSPPKTFDSPYITSEQAKELTSILNKCPSDYRAKILHGLAIMTVPVKPDLTDLSKGAYQRMKEAALANQIKSKPVNEEQVNQDDFYEEP